MVKRDRSKLLVKPYWAPSILQTDGPCHTTVKTNFLAVVLTATFLVQ